MNLKVNIPENPQYHNGQKYSLVRVVEVEIDYDEILKLALAIKAAQESSLPTLGICAAFQAFVYAVKSSVLTAFRRPPQRG